MNNEIIFIGKLLVGIAVLIVVCLSVEKAFPGKGDDIYLMVLIGIFLILLGEYRKKKNEE